MTTLSRRPANAFPRISSDWPPLYVTAVSKYVIPASIAWWTSAMASSPNSASPSVVVPNPISDTRRSEVPRFRSFSGELPRGLGRDALHGCRGVHVAPRLLARVEADEGVPLAPDPLLDRSGDGRADA